MSISRFYTTSCVVTRMTWSNESSALAAVGTVKGHIQQARPEFAEQIGEAWAQTFLLWCSKGADIAAGDQVVIASGDYAGTYRVKNRQINAVGSNQHAELTLIKGPA